MRITDVNIIEDEDLGLQEIRMKRLGQVVILAGKNGSGKTRILNSIKNTNENRFNIIESINNEGLVDNLNNKIIVLENNINVLKGQPDFKNDIKAINEYNQYAKEISDYRTQIRYYRKVESDKLIISNGETPFQIIEFVPKSLLLKDSGTLTQNDLINYRNRLITPGISMTNDSTFATIQVTQNNWFNVTHQNSFSSEEDILVQKERYENLSSLISTFLNTTLSRDADGYCLMFGKKFNELNLSDGQKIILQLCVAIFSQEARLNDLILFLDEPENHLHPQALKEVVNRIIECIPNGQIWIATHSISLLSQFDPNCIWYVDEGKVEHAGKSPEKVLRGLLGKEDDISKLQDFLDLPSQFAMSRYAMECLLPPDVLMTSFDDPQINQINKNLNTLAGNENLKVLDFGAGKGRLLNNLHELLINENKVLNDTINYIAYDLFDSDKDMCVKNLCDVYGDSKDRYYNSFTSILENHDEKSFDVVVMCNVFHEIDPQFWIKLFKKDGDLDGIIKDDGYLLIVEDNQIPKGEKAYAKGFLVLDTIHLKELFKIPADEGKFIIDSRKDGRLKAHLIPKMYLKSISQDTIKKTMETIRKSSIEKINTLRNNNVPSYAEGKLHAFYSQQLTNAILTLDQL